MSQDPSSAVRRLLPQNAQMGSFTFAPPTTYQQPREQQKNYVFVDEHNRHKRLKVMRACEGCRRRKIKCDAATTNTWPCSACVRLKLHCVRPNGFEDTTGEDEQAFEHVRPPYDDPAAPDPYQQAVPLHVDQQLLDGAQRPDGNLYSAQTTYADSSGQYITAQYPPPAVSQTSLHYAGVGLGNPTYPPQPVFPTPPLQHSSAPDSPSDSFGQDRFGGQQDLADLLGSLKVDDTGTAPYLNSRMGRDREEEPAVEEADDYKSALPHVPSGPGLKIRIPPELMPDDETIRLYFDLYFSNVHPYVPVLDRNSFLQQWHTGRESLSPLLLEAVFAIAGRLADEPAQGQQWLALASKHADSFMDVPRLSTLQALLILLKARESTPKRGYFYRSWMSIVQCVQMAKDLGLDEHLSDHAAGRSCGFPTAECLLRSRIWQTVFVCEVMIGSPQGRSDLAVEIESVDFTVPRALPGSDEAEVRVSRQFTYFALIVRNIGRLNKAYNRVKKTKDWAMDSELVNLGPSFHVWLSDLPTDMVVSYPPDGSPPWLSSPVTGNLHSYYYLSIILFHRPQLTLLDPSAATGQWKHHMTMCYNSAKLLCRLQEAMLQNFGLNGLQCMQRGISFTIYAILSCIVLHLVAITSPDPDLNGDAREYFTRHMRILEKVMGTWPMPEMQKQVDAVREAFSADLRRPFVLKPSFPYGSPSTSSGGSPPMHDPPYGRAMPRSGMMDRRLDAQPGHLHHQGSFGGHPVSPPTSTGPGELGVDGVPPAQQPLVMMAGPQHAQQNVMQTMSMAGAPSWNPARIFDQWNTTFGTPQAQPVTAASQGSSISGQSPGAETTSLQDLQAAQAGLHHDANQVPVVQYPPPTVPTFMTPAMWQESVASVYEGGLKRGWDFDTTTMPMTKRR